MNTAGTDALAGWQVVVRRTIARPPMDVFSMVTDVERMAGLGPEHRAARWLGEPRGKGARFEGVNRIGFFEWKVVCYVTIFEPPYRFGWTVGDMGAPSSTWTYRLEATADGAATSVVHTFEHGPGDSFVRRAVERVPATGRNLIAARTAQLQHNMNATLHQVEVQLLRNERS